MIVLHRKKAIKLNKFWKKLKRKSTNLGESFSNEVCQFNLMSEQQPEAENSNIEAQVANMATKSIQEIRNEIALLESNIPEYTRGISKYVNERKALEAELQSTNNMIKQLKRPPFLVGNVVETLELDEEDAADTYLGADPHSAVIRTTARQTVFLPITGLLKASEIEPSDLIEVSKDSFIIYGKLPPHYDARVKTMEIDTKPTETYNDVGGLDQQIQELKEAVILPLTHPERLKKIGIKAPKGVLLFGPPGTGKTMLARACAASTDSTFLRLAASQLVQKYVGEGAKIVREAFELARQKAPTIIFIDEIDAIGGKRSTGDNVHGEREVSRTMLELLNQLDGFQELDNVKVICATNRPDVLDPALMRSGRLDRKIELPLPNEEARVQILEIHSKKMKVDESVNFREIARSTEDFNGAMLRAVCVEAGMIALRHGATIILHEDYIEGISAVQAKKTAILDYFS